MDKTTKFILGLIAVALIGINIQMWNGKLIKDAHAIDRMSIYGTVPVEIINWPRR